MPETSIDISRLIDEQKIGSFAVKLVILSFLVMLTDGYDLLATSYGAPALIGDWRIKPSDLSWVFSASPVGMVIGSPLLGWFGDRYGRRSTVILGAVVFGVFSLACATATSIPEIVALRFLTGIGLGGMMPNITALNAEFAPQRVRATLVVLMFMGVTAGSTLPGVVIWAFAQAGVAIGWRELYVVGGVAPLVLAAVLYVWLPESVKFLSLQDGARARAQLARIIRRVRPDLTLSAQTTFFSSEARATGGVPVAELFRDGFQWITPILWLLFVANLTANYFLYSWMPVLFHSTGFSPSEAALTTVFYYIGGVTGGLAISRFIDKLGVLPIAIFFAVGCVAVACIGLPGLSTVEIVAFVTLSGFCVLGVQLGLNAASGLIYPTRIRATGAGWSFGIGRLGGIFGPTLGGVLIAMHLSTGQLFLAPAAPMAIGAIACFILVGLCRRRFHGPQLGDRAGTAATRVVVAGALDPQPAQPTRI